MATHHLNTRPTVNHNAPYDSALADHLAELKETCRELGAIEMRVLRDAEMAWLYYETISQDPGNPDVHSPSKSRTIGELRIPKSGVIPSAGSGQVSSPASQPPTVWIRGWNNDAFHHPTP